ncbi:uncharacterized protein LOC112904509 [Agrilus planipennis]|uniref:Uncharacterized protein LOC112904509 n=1 Tax=Agrilus planipennis TaxID=224129 RepID=A0A7F5R3X8_AGRPL|nr:uncharacterized protein LOC112904509 [Agrilus planipennis]
MESEIYEQEAEGQRKRRSSIFFAPEEEVVVDVKFSRVHYPADYYNKLQEEYRQWKETLLDLKNSFLNSRKELQENKKHPIDMALLDKEQQQFFKNVPAVYFNYIKTFQEFLDEVHTASVIFENVTKCKKVLANDLEERVKSTDKNLKEHLRTVCNK